MKVSVFRFLAAFSLALAILNAALLAHFAAENAKLREAVEVERLLCEEAARLHAKERARYESLYRNLTKALEENREINDALMEVSGKVVVPKNYTVILEREDP